MFSVSNAKNLAFSTPDAKHGFVYILIVISDVVAFITTTSLSLSQWPSYWISLSF